jgi:hypothetical protein
LILSLQFHNLRSRSGKAAAVFARAAPGTRDLFLPRTPSILAVNSCRFAVVLHFFIEYL